VRSSSCEPHQRLRIASLGQAAWRQVSPAAAPPPTPTPPSVRPSQLPPLPRPAPPPPPPYPRRLRRLPPATAAELSTTCTTHVHDATVSHETHLRDIFRGGERNGISCTIGLVIVLNERHRVPALNLRAPGRRISDARSCHTTGAFADCLKQLPRPSIGEPSLVVDADPLAKPHQLVVILGTGKPQSGNCPPQAHSHGAPHSRPAVDSSAAPQPAGTDHQRATSADPPRPPM
jgi:hypothetical protein